ncbi:MAG: hypothetical protein INF69_08715 [Roseomonas sp.]|nr:hypothetical protein [Roseomonas sp.]
MGELIILTADGTMRAVLQTFFSRQFHHAFGCAPFAFDPANDIINDPLHTDGGVHLHCHEILRPYLNTHKRALVLLDQKFGGQLPAAKVSADIEKHLGNSGWSDFAAIVIDPELEVLLWQDNPNVDQALRHTGDPLRQLLAQDGRWPAGMAKPPQPKNLIQAIINANRAGPPMVVYSRIASRVAANGCIDPAFHRVRDTLRAWFPMEAA